ncbi:flagellar biosynthetic protein FliR [Marivita sp. S0852]|uniref:flagellar biosynthetic protein FliR n=1 Tax=Marivita sp. S0852 TaxID=3373893 RepID=UPI003982CFFA
MMIEGLTQELNSQLWLVYAIFLRVGPAISLMPGYGEKSVPPQVKVMLALFLSSAAAPILEPFLPPEPPLGKELLYFTVRETTVGFFLGLISRGALFLLQKAGAVISQSVSLSQMLGNAVDPMPVISHILTVSGLALFFTTPLSDHAIFALLSSFHLDLSSLSNLWGFFAENVIALISYVTERGITLSAGFIALFSIYYLFTGFTNKAMPQFMITFIGIPFVSLLSIFFYTITTI